MRLTHKERFLAAIQGRDSDRIPVVGNLTEQLAEKFAAEMHLPVDMQDSFLATRISHRNILLRLGNDAVLVGACRAAGRETKPIGDGRVIDEFGIEYEKVGLYTEAVRRPLEHASTPEDVAALDFPRCDAAGRWDHARIVIAKHGGDYGVIGDMEATIFELAWNLVGMEKFLMDITTEEPYIPVLLDKIAAYATNCGLMMIDLGADMLWTGDDVGTQNGMMISPNIWREHFKPRMKAMFAAFKARKPDIVIAYHSCGSIRPIIPDLIEIGLDILNPLQPLATGMALEEFYQLYADQLIFFGAIDVQELLPNGTPAEIEAEVIRCMQATKGGRRFIIAPAHNIQPDTPLENIYAFYAAVEKHGGIEVIA